MDKSPLLRTLLLVAGIVSGIAGCLTLIPYPGAADTNIIGYKSMCSFTPVSTVICWFGASTFWGLRQKKEKS